MLFLCPSSHLIVAENLYTRTWFMYRYAYSLFIFLGLTQLKGGHRWDEPDANEWHPE